MSKAQKNIYDKMSQQNLLFIFQLQLKVKKKGHFN